MGEVSHGFGETCVTGNGGNGRTLHGSDAAEVMEAIKLRLVIKNKRLPQRGQSAALVAGLAAARHAASLFAGLLIVSVLLELAQQPALLQLHVEALQGAVDRFIRLNGNVDQNLVIASARVYYGPFGPEPQPLVRGALLFSVYPSPDMANRDLTRSASPLNTETVPGPRYR